MAQSTPNYGLSMPDATDDFLNFRESYNDNMVIIDDNLGGGGSGSLDAVETTSIAYAQLPQADKDNPTKIYFLNDTQSSEVETPVDFSSFVNSTESSTTISVVNDELVYTWNGGSSIRQNSYYPTAIPASVKKIKYKLTTGASSYYNNRSADARWQICIGVKASYSTADIYPTDSNWLVNAIYNTVNDVIEGELDLSNITSDCYLMICAKGWNLTWNEISTVEDSEPTGETKIKYKDITYGDGNGGGSGGLTKDVIYQNSGSSIPSTITLDHGISEYDMIVLSGYRSQYPTYWASKTYLSDECVTNRNIGLTDDAMYGWYTVTNDTTLTLIGSANMVIDKIYGLKY